MLGTALARAVRISWLYCGCCRPSCRSCLGLGCFPSCHALFGSCLHSPSSYHPQEGTWKSGISGRQGCKGKFRKNATLKLRLCAVQCQTPLLQYQIAVASPCLSALTQDEPSYALSTGRRNAGNAYSLSSSFGSRLDAGGGSVPICSYWAWSTNAAVSMLLAGSQRATVQDWLDPECH